VEGEDPGRQRSVTSCASFFRTRCLSIHTIILFFFSLANLVFRFRIGIDMVPYGVKALG